MGIAVARFGAEPLSVKCRICGRATPRGAKLCLQCVAAVKRARDVKTVTTQFLPKAGLGTAYPTTEAPRSASRRRSPRSSWLPTKASGWGVVAAFALFGAAVGATAYLAVQEIGEKPEPVGVPSLPTEVSVVRPDVEPRVETATVVTTAVTDQTDEATGVESMPAAEPSPAGALPQRRAPRKAATATHSARNTIRPSVAAPAPATQIVAASADPEPAQERTPPALASAAIAPAPAARDRWDGMNAALAACSNEAFLAGVVCTERVRLEYCEGFWGQVPQCRAATRPGTPR